MLHREDAARYWQEVAFAGSVWFMLVKIIDHIFRFLREEQDRPISWLPTLRTTLPYQMLTQVNYQVSKF
jgi:hypothetical protein